jgi:hypothetical protein
MVDTYLCSICGENHRGVPLSWGPDAPDLWAALPRVNHEGHGELGTDQCVMDEEHWFIRGRVEIPVVDGGDRFAWLAWVEVSEDDFLAMSDMWTVEGREKGAPYKGRLANNLPLYSDPALDLQVRLHTRPVGVRPFIEIVEDHLLRLEQRDGISSHRVQEISDRMQGNR